jgi:predicted enzyme related to lactoylglutathione lyase
MEIPMKSALNWFEIPVEDMTRARRFYGALFDTELHMEPMCGGEMALLPYEQPAVGGCLFWHEALMPSSQGSLIYLNAGDDLSPMLARVETAGGRITLPKTLINEQVGYMALFIDSEGNRVGLHSPG